MAPHPGSPLALSLSIAPPAGGTIGQMRGQRRAVTDAAGEEPYAQWNQQ